MNDQTFHDVANSSLKSDPLNNLEIVAIDDKKFLEKNERGKWETFVKLEGSQIVVEDLRLSKNYFPDGKATTSLDGKVKRPFRPIGRTENFETEISFLPLDENITESFPFQKNSLNIIHHYTKDGKPAFIKSHSYVFLHPSAFEQLISDLSSLNSKAKIVVQSSSGIIFGNELNGKIWGTHDVDRIEPIGINLNPADKSVVEMSDSQFKRIWRCDVLFISLHIENCNDDKLKKEDSSAILTSQNSEISQLKLENRLQANEKQNQLIEKSLSSVVQLMERNSSSLENLNRNLGSLLSKFIFPIYIVATSLFLLAINILRS